MCVRDGFFFKDNLCGERGLEAGSELQTFVITLSKQIRSKMNGIVEKMPINQHNELRLTGIEATTAKMENVATVCAEINLLSCFFFFFVLFFTVRKFLKSSKKKVLMKGKTKKIINI